MRAIGPNQGSSLRHAPGHIREIERKDVNKALDGGPRWVFIEPSVMLIRLALFVYFVTLHGVRVI